MANIETLADLSPILKNVYLPIRKKAFPFMTPLLAQAKRGGPDRVRYAGNDLFFVVKLDRRGGFVSSARGFLPDSKDAREKQGRLGIARTYATVEVDGLAARSTEDTRGAYISATKKLVEDVMEQWQLEQERILQGDSRGVRALVKTRTSATIIVVDSPYGIASSGPGNLHLVVGDVAASHDSSASFAFLAKATITDIVLAGDDATLTFDATIEGAGTIAAGDVIVTAVPAATNATDTSFGAEPNGLMSIIDVENNFATFEGISDERWVAQKTTSSTGAIDEVLIMKLLNTIRARAGVEWRNDPKAMLLLTTTGIWQSYGDSLLGLRRFAAPTMTLNGGFTGVQVANATLIDDPWNPRGRLYAIHTPDTIFVDLMDFNELTLQDSTRWQRVNRRDAWEVVFASYWNYGVTVRNSHGVISNITDTENFSPIF